MFYKKFKKGEESMFYIYNRKTHIFYTGEQILYSMGRYLLAYAECKI